MGWSPEGFYRKKLKTVIIMPVQNEILLHRIILPACPEVFKTQPKSTHPVAKERKIILNIRYFL
ncbi:MAG: hypothetical protein KAU58_04935 [Candidatus Omnitrophica bacterium]|nr:hypothetical protein [Candidatus Omnitrophota bacterium]